MRAADERHRPSERPDRRGHDRLAPDRIPARRRPRLGCRRDHRRRKRLRDREPAAQQHLRDHLDRPAHRGHRAADRQGGPARRRRPGLRVEALHPRHGRAGGGHGTGHDRRAVAGSALRARVPARSAGARDRVRLLVPAADPLLRAVRARRRGAQRAARLRSVHLGADREQRRLDRGLPGVHRALRLGCGRRRLDAADDRPAGRHRDSRHRGAGSHPAPASGGARGCTCVPTSAGAVSASISSGVWPGGPS